MAVKAILTVCCFTFSYFSWPILSCCCFFCLSVPFVSLPQTILYYLGLFVEQITLISFCLLFLSWSLVLQLSVVVHHKQSSRDFLLAPLHPTLFSSQHKKKIFTRTDAHFHNVDAVHRIGLDAREPCRSCQGTGSLTCAAGLRGNSTLQYPVRPPAEFQVNKLCRMNNSVTVRGMWRREIKRGREGRLMRIEGCLVPLKPWSCGSNHSAQCVSDMRCLFRVLSSKPLPRMTSIEN